MSSQSSSTSLRTCVVRANHRPDDAGPQRGGGALRRHPDPEPRASGRARRSAHAEALVSRGIRRHGDLRSAAAGDRGGAGSPPSDPLVDLAQHGRDDAEGRRRRHPRGGERARRARARPAARGRRREPRRHFRRADEGRIRGRRCGRGAPGRRVMSALSAVMYREGKIRATNALFIFWDVIYPLGYLLVFGVGMNDALGFAGLTANYHACFLAGVLGMAGFGIASNTAWSFFMDRDNGIFYEMLTYPISRAQYLVGKVLFNVAI